MGIMFAFCRHMLRSFANIVHVQFALNQDAYIYMCETEIGFKTFFVITLYR